MTILGIIFLLAALMQALLASTCTWKDTAREYSFGAMLSLVISIICFVLD